MRLNYFKLFICIVINILLVQFYYGRDDFVLRDTVKFFSFHQKINISLNDNLYYIDKDLDGKALLKDAVIKSTVDSTCFNLFSHGRSGELLIEGEWLNAKEISRWIALLPQIKILNIYGCEFAKGEKGMQAVAYLENKLNIKVNASTNITGKDGDWYLENGNYSLQGLSYYSYNLQCINQDTGAHQDFDCDGVINSLDLDDDNDGILDAVESPSCFYTETEATDIVSITSDGSYFPFEQTRLDALAAGSTAAGFNFINAIDINGGAYFSFELEEYTELSSIEINMLNKQSFLNSGNNTTTTNTQVIVQGSLDGASWIDLSASTFYDRIATDNVEIFPITQNAGAYKYYRIIGDPAVTTSDTFLAGVVNQIILNTNNYVQSLHPKLTCSEDVDDDGIYNHLDLDSDGDGCPDTKEASVSPTTELQNGNVINGNGTDATANTTTLVSNAQLNPDGVDTNNDGLNDSVDADLNGVPDYTSTYFTEALDSALSSKCSTVCFKPGVVGTGLESINGVSTLNREKPSSEVTNWPTKVKNGILVLDSKEKGFVVTRMADPETTFGTNAVEGMLVYDTDNNCLKMFNGSSWACLVQTCVDN